VHLRAGFGDGSCRRHPVCLELSVHRSADGHAAGPEGLRRRGARRHRQHRRRGGGRAGHRPGRDLRGGPGRLHLSRCRGLRGADPDPAAAAHGPAGQRTDGEGLMPARAQMVLLSVLAVIVVVSALSGRYNPYYLDIAVTCGINVTLAVSLNLINGYTGQFSLGHAGFMGVGAYAAAVLTTSAGSVLLGVFGGQEWLLFAIALLAGGCAAALAGLVVGVPSLRLRGDYLAIVTLGFGEIIRVVLQNIDAVGGARGLAGIPGYTNLGWTLGIAAFTTYAVWAMVHSSWGRGFIAVADDEIAAEAMGINTTRYKITAFLVGAFFAGVAGGVYAHFRQYIAPQGFGFERSIEIVVMVILGGMGNATGVIAAGILLMLAGEWLRQFGDLRMILYSLLIVVLMITRPQGLFRWGSRARKAGA